MTCHADQSGRSRSLPLTCGGVSQRASGGPARRCRPSPRWPRTTASARPRSRGRCASWRTRDWSGWYLAGELLGPEIDVNSHANLESVLASRCRRSSCARLPSSYSSQIQQPRRTTPAVGGHRHTYWTAPPVRGQDRAASLHPEGQGRAGRSRQGLSDELSDNPSGLGRTWADSSGQWSPGTRGNSGGHARVALPSGRRGHLIAESVRRCIKAVALPAVRLSLAKSRSAGAAEDHHFVHVRPLGRRQRGVGRNRC